MNEPVTRSWLQHDATAICVNRDCGHVRGRHYLVAVSDVHDDAPCADCSCGDFRSHLSRTEQLELALQAAEDRVHRLEDVVAGCETCSAALDETE